MGGIAKNRLISLTIVLLSIKVYLLFSSWNIVIISRILLHLNMRIIGIRIDMMWVQINLRLRILLSKLLATHVINY